MARIRTIKPDFWTDEKIVELDPLERLLFIGLWNFADDQGYMDYSPKRIKMQVFPGDDIDVSRALASLLEGSLIRLYSSPAGLVLHIPTWTKHQRISNPSRARFTGPDLQECGPEDWPLASPLEGSVRKGRERKGREVSFVSSTDEPETEDHFYEFWASYPRKTAKRKAEQAWRAAIKRADPQVILAGLRSFQFSPDAQFQPHPASWLNADRWADQAPVQLGIVSTDGYTTAELDTILGPPPPMPQPPSHLTGDEMWDWDQNMRRQARADRVRRANEKLGRTS